jgi:hypothetical protein
MIDLRFGRYALGAAALVAMLAGCGGAQSPMASPGAFNLSHKVPDTEQSQTFSFTGRKQTFTVPTGVTRIKVTASGASGYNYSPGGLGGLISAVVRVTPGESLAVFVGGEGTYYGVGGYNGGGNGNCDPAGCGGGGGGASDVRQGGSKLKDRVVVAGGGGAQGEFGGGCGCGNVGGAGGGRTGATGGR